MKRAYQFLFPKRFLMLEARLDGRTVSPLMHESPILTPFQTSIVALWLLPPSASSNGFCLATS